MFKKGQDVWVVKEGQVVHGVVVDIDESLAYPLYIAYDNGKDEAYTIDGRNFEHESKPSLFTNPIMLLEIEPDPEYPFVRVDENGGIYSYRSKPNILNNGEWDDSMSSTQPVIINWKTAGINTTQKVTVNLGEITGTPEQIAEIQESIKGLTK